MSGDEHQGTEAPQKAKSSLLERATQDQSLNALVRRGSETIDTRGAPEKPMPSRAKPVAAPAPQVAAPQVVVVTTPAPAPVAIEVPVAETAAQIKARRTQSNRPIGRGAVQKINRAGLAADGYIDPDGAMSEIAEEYRLIKRRLLRQVDRFANGHRIMVTSANPNEGKTFCAINLALSIAGEQDSEILLIDADFARSRVTKLLGLYAEQGFMDALADSKVDVEDLIIRTDIPKLTVLPAGRSSSRNSEFLASERTEDLLSRIEEGSPNRIILIDTMPLLATSSASVLANRMGQILVVVRADHTRESALRDAIGLMGAHEGISLLLNRTSLPFNSRSFGTYYEDGQGA